ncbi:Oidioi.mRNA.OKI2018_I69.chr2.g7443.t1.cds [Oikopleura dioica]|uniref:Oidioi.mRNA.OKI2018_I69.chr2.g7443.t1.cds n=1 Tax=Oikopleura dioica TaxID=34765 RepID=A0ABN7TD22_OIKDI|nr:Oidioi.mRNA.OKI2018_I69.chr2.g7443.t1.cds [Oikopleura dioica]
MNRINAVVTQSCNELNLACPGFKKASFSSEETSETGLARARPRFSSSWSSINNIPGPASWQQGVNNIAHNHPNASQNRPYGRPSHTPTNSRPHSSNNWSTNQRPPQSAWIKIPKFSGKFSGRNMDENSGPFVNLYKHRKDGSYNIRRHFEG